MSLRKRISCEGKNKPELTGRIIGLSLLALSLIIAGHTACKKAEEVEVPEEKSTVVKEGMNEFEGTVKVAHGKFMYVPKAQGFDIVVQGSVDSGDATALVGKEVKVQGLFSHARPSILIAESIDVKEKEGVWKNVFTRTEETILEDFFDPKSRYDYPTLKITAFNKSEEWEGNEKGKVPGKLETSTVTEGGEEKTVCRIVLFDDKRKEIGSIIVDDVTEYAKYYIKKLRLFDTFWFYLNVKDTVEWRTRRQTRELFHADLIFAGIF